MTLNKILSDEMITACNTHNLNLIGTLISDGENIDSQDQFDASTVLHHAALTEDLILVKIILQYNPNPLLKDIVDETPLDIAYSKGNKELIKLLKIYVNQYKNQQISKFIRSVKQGVSRAFLKNIR